MSTSTSMPAPVLASTLFTCERQDRRGGSSEPTVWKTGVKSLDRDFAEGVFRGGSIVGVGGVGALHQRAQRLIHNLITTHLIESSSSTSISSPLHTPTDQQAQSQSQSQPQSPTVFIVEPATTPSRETALLQIYSLLSTDLQYSQQQQQQKQNKQRQTTNLDTDIDTLIDKTSILPYFDLIGLSEALSEITEVLTTTTATTTHSHSNPHSTAPITIILLRSLCSTLSTLLTRTSPTQTAALLGEITRQLRRLVRLQGNERDVLVLIELSVGEGVEVRGMNRGVDDRSGRSLESAFSSRDGRGLRLKLDEDDGEVRGGREVVGAEMLLGLVERAVDAVVLVHRGLGVVDGGTGSGDDGGEEDRLAERCIVEVVKDDAGTAMGVWAVWEDST